VHRSSALQLSPEVSSALAGALPIVALESSVFAQGLPVPDNRRAAELMREAIRERKAVPAITGVVRGVPTVGIKDADLDRFLGRRGIHKVSARDLPWAMAKRMDGATTVASTLMLAVLAGISVFATGGIGGVHHEPEFDESADLFELSRSPVIVVCAGAKSVLDLRATMERLETLGVSVIGYRTSELPGFFTVSTGIPLTATADSVTDIAAAWRAHRELGRPGAILVVQPPPADLALERTEVEGLVERSYESARKAGVHGAAITPYLLAEISKATNGRSLAVNIGLLARNAALGAEIAVEIAQA
jgi:pseudouridine-5'-phosphate glycosidase